MKKNLNEEIRKIRSMMYQESLNESFGLDDIADYLRYKIGDVGSVTFGDDMDAVLTGDVSQETVNSLKSNVTGKDADKLTDKEKMEIYSKAITDDDFYNAILFGINAPQSQHNINFLKYWRIAEMGMENVNKLKKTATNNPLNTTQPNNSDPRMTKFNSVGVRNYSEPKFGIHSTVKTLKNGFYDCIVDGLRKEKDYSEITACKSRDGETPAMNIWGTGKDHLNQVIKSIKDPKNARSIDKTLDEPR